MSSALKIFKTAYGKGLMSFFGLFVSIFLAGKFDSLTYKILLGALIFVGLAVIPEVISEVKLLKGKEKKIKNRVLKHFGVALNESGIGLFTYKGVDVIIKIMPLELFYIQYHLLRRQVDELSVKPNFQLIEDQVDDVLTYRILESQSSYLNSIRKRIKTTIKNAVNESKRI